MADGGLSLLGQRALTTLVHSSSFEEHNQLVIPRETFRKELGNILFRAGHSTKQCKTIVEAILSKVPICWELVICFVVVQFVSLAMMLGESSIGPLGAGPLGLVLLESSRVD